MTRKLLCLFVLVLLLMGTVFSLAPLAQSGDLKTERVLDRTGCLKEGELAALTSKAARLSEETGAELYILLSKEYGYIGEEVCADFGISMLDDVILLVLYRSPSEWYYDLYTYGDAQTRVSGAEVDRILDHPDVYGNIKEKGEIYSALDAYLDLAAKAYKGKLYPRAGVLVPFILIGALLVTGGVVGGVAYAYCHKQKKVSYPLDKYASLRLTTEQDVFRGITTTRRRVSSNSGGGGRSGGGGGRSGGGGGGSGHRGGR